MTTLRVVFNQRRRDLGLTFEQLAEASGVTRQTLLNISSGKYIGDLRTWLKLARAFGSGMDELVASVWVDEGNSFRADGRPESVQGGRGE